MFGALRGIRDPFKQTIQPETVIQMRLLGFEQEESLFALKLTGGDFEKAVNLLRFLAESN
jgi:hypothetical protein